MFENFDVKQAISEITDPKALRIIFYLVDKIKVLEERVAVLEKNSGNSSKPPSSDIVKPKEQQRQPGVRTAGGQSKHPGVKHKLKPIEQVDEVKEIVISNCPKCGEELEVTEQQQVLQQYELVSKPVKLTEYRNKGCKCKKCNKIFYSELPKDLVRNHLCGIKLESFIHYSKSVLAISYSDLEELLRDVFKVSISRSTICNIIKIGFKSLKPLQEELLKLVRNQANIHIDETSWYEKHRLRWCWDFCNEKIAYFVIRDSRGTKVPTEILGKDFKGNITTDFYGAYTSFDKTRHQFCLAHLIRDIKFLITLPSDIDKDFGNNLLVYFKKIFILWNSKKEGFIDKLKQLIKKLHNFLARTKTAGKSKTLHKRILKRWDCLFRFVDNPEIFAPTNNEAERTLRFVTKIRRLTLGSQSAWGISWSEAVFSIIATCRKHHISIFNLMNSALERFYFKTPYSSVFLLT